MTAAARCFARRHLSAAGGLYHRNDSGLYASARNLESAALAKDYVTRRNRVWKKLSLIGLLVLALVPQGLALKLKIVVEGQSGDWYQIRHGLQDSEGDLIVGPFLGEPLCFKMGSRLGLQIEWEETTPGDWYLYFSELESLAGGPQYWWEGPSYVAYGPNDTHWFPDEAPDFIERALLKAMIILATPNEDPPETGFMSTGWYYTSETFFVLDAPVTPMAPAWANVLRISCTWAREETTAAGAAAKLTEKLLRNGRYVPIDGWWYAIPGDGGSPPEWYIEDEAFYLRSFIEGHIDSVPLKGQCNDFADFLVCLTTSVGGYPMRAQRSYSLAKAMYLPHSPDWPRWKIYTNPVFYAPWNGESAGYEERDFNYHQFATYTGYVWDAAMHFGGSPGIAINWLATGTYKTRLVEYFEKFFEEGGSQIVMPGSGDPWSLHPAAGVNLVLFAASINGE